MPEESALIDLKSNWCFCKNQQPHTSDCLSKQAAVKKYQIEYKNKQLKHQNHQAKYGEVNPLKSTIFNGKRVVLVSGELYQSTSPSAKDNPHDLYCCHLIDLLGKEWFLNPNHSDHPIVFWFQQMCTYMNKQEEDYVVPSAYASAFMILAYDIFCLRSHGSLQKKFIDKLRGKHKNYKEFQGIRYELTIYALLIRAGFELQYEDESDGSTMHTELVATHKHTHQKITVEVKASHRAGILGATEGKNFNLVNLLNNAMKKPFNYPYIIFIDANYPPEQEDPCTSTLFNWIKKGIVKFEKSHASMLPNVIFITNITHHWAENHSVIETELRHSFWEKIFENPRFKPSQDIITLIRNALEKYGEIQNSF